MDAATTRKTLGDTGVVGIVLLALGIVVVGRENRRAALGVLAVVVGYSLVAHGLVGSFLESMGMDYEDLT